MARKKSAKKNTGKSTSSSASKAAGKKRKYNPKPKVEPVELQQYWNLQDNDEGSVEVSENPAEAPASVYVPENPSAPSSDDGTRVIDIDDYQPIVWVPSEAAAKPAEPAEPAEPARPAELEEAEPVRSAEPEQPAMSAEPKQAAMSAEPEQPAMSAEPEQPARSADPEQAHESDAHREETPKAQSKERVREALYQPEEINKAPFEPEETTELKDDGAEQIAIDFDDRAADYKRARLAARVAGAAFFGVLVLMLILNIVTKDVLYSDQENRVFQQLPKFSIGNYLSGRFESQLDNYVSDQFAGRNAFIKIKSSADLTIGQIKANGVFKAKDCYLMEDITYPDKEEVSADLKALKQFKKKYKKQKMYFMLVPNAANILSDKLPSGVFTRDQNKDIDKVLKSLKKMGYEPIDVRDELKKASKKQQVYYRTDHHWTTDGAYIAYKKAAKVMDLKSETEYEPLTVKKDFLGTLYSKSGFTSGRKDPIRIYLPKGDKYLNSVIRYKDKKEKTTMYYDMANLDIKDAYTVFGGTNQSVITISTPTKTNKHLLVVKDSYANCFIPFLTQDYRTITIVDPRYYYENIATVMKADEIDDVLFLYNANTFFDDNYMRMMLTNK